MASPGDANQDLFGAELLIGAQTGTWGEVRKPHPAMGIVVFEACSIPTQADVIPGREGVTQRSPACCTHPAASAKSTLEC